MTTAIAAQSTAHSSAFSVNKALQNRHGKGHVQFALPASAGQAAANAAPPPAQSAAKPPPSPGNLLTHPLLAHIAGQSAQTIS